MDPAACHRLRQPGIMINANCHVRIRYPSSVVLKHIGHQHGTGMPRSLQQFQMQSTISRDARLLLTGESRRLLDQPVQTNEITFIQRHESGKTGWFCALTNSNVAISNHAGNITQQFRSTVTPLTTCLITRDLTCRRWCLQTDLTCRWRFNSTNPENLH